MRLVHLQHPHSTDKVHPPIVRYWRGPGWYGEKSRGRVRIQDLVALDDAGYAAKEALRRGMELPIWLEEHDHYPSGYVVTWDEVGAPEPTTCIVEFKGEHGGDSFDLGLMVDRLNDACGDGKGLELEELQEIRAMIVWLCCSRNEGVSLTLSRVPELDNREGLPQSR